MASESQKEKKAAAQAYDYEHDGRWAEYWSNVLPPAHLTGRPEVLQHFKLKFYQRHIDPELHVEPLSALGGSRSSTPSTTAARQESSPSTAGHQPPSSAGVRNNQTGGTGGNFRQASAPLWQMDQQSFKFLANAFVTLMALVAIFPLAPISISNRAYQFTLWVTAITSLYSIYLQHGKPQSWNSQGIQIWLQSVFTGKEFFYVLFALVFATSSFPIKIAVIPVLCQSLVEVAVFLRSNFSNTQLFRRYLQIPCSWLISNSNALRRTGVNTEIGIGFFLLFLLVTPQRSFIQTFGYWQLLKLLYNAPATAPYHRNSWSVIGMRANPLIRQYAPFLETPINFVRRWFLS